MGQMAGLGTYSASLTYEVPGGVASTTHGHIHVPEPRTEFTSASARSVPIGTRVDRS